jgi:transcriptional regulator with XRE-family HTH domain
MFHNAQIKILRNSREWSLADVVFELAKLSHRYTRQTISNWELGVTEPKASDIGCLAEVFGVSVQSFFKPEIE